MDCGCSERISVPLRKDLFLLFSCSYSLWLHRLQHARLPCPSLSPGACSNSCPLSWWCHLIISSSVIPFSSCPQSFPAPGSFPMSQLFTSGGQSIGTSASESVLPMNIQSWFPLVLTGLISLLPKGFSSLLEHHSSKTSTLWHSAFFMVQLSDPYTTSRKTIALTIRTFVSQVMSLLFHTLSRFVTAFPPRSKRLLIHKYRFHENTTSIKTQNYHYKDFLHVILL